MPSWRNRVTNATSLDELRAMFGLGALPATQAETYTAPDGTKFTDINAYNNYLQTNNQQTFDRNRQLGLSQAQNYARQAIQQRGLSEADYLPLLQQEIDRINGSIPNLAGNPQGYFDPNLANNFLNGIQQGKRSQYGNQVQSTFGGNYANQAIGDTELDNTINELLNQQSSIVTDALDRGLKRGQLNQRGFDAGQQALGTSKTLTSAKLNQTENDVLNGYRSRLSGVADKAAASASGYQLGGNFNLGDYTAQADSVINDFKTNGSGQFLNAVGKDPLFDLSSILGKSGQAQGAVNLNNLDVLDAVNNKIKTQGASRGIGSQGSF